MGVEQSDLPRCANCDVEISWRPVVHRGKTYCCGGCAQGGPCYCSYDLSLLDWQPHARARRSPHRDSKGVRPDSGQ
jgi:hypothetical protein